MPRMHCRAELNLSAILSYTAQNSSRASSSLAVVVGVKNKLATCGRDDA